MICCKASGKIFWSFYYTHFAVLEFIQYIYLSRNKAVWIIAPLPKTTVLAIFMLFYKIFFEKLS